MATPNTEPNTDRKRKRKDKKKDKKSKKTAKNDTTDNTVPVDSSSGEQFTFFFRKESPFSQWHPARFTVDGITFSCAEQFMMYQKAILFNDNEMAQEILSTDDPREHKALGRKVSNFDQAIWNDKCQSLVKQGNLAKFGQNPTLWQKLKATEGTTLVEASPFDRIWGIGLAATNPKANNRKTWRGRNLLGQILTQVREELDKSQSPHETGTTGTTDSYEGGETTTDLPSSNNNDDDDGTITSMEHQQAKDEIPELPRPTIDTSQ